jgi:RNA polymerase sigma-H factor
MNNISLYVLWRYIKLTEQDYFGLFPSIKNIKLDKDKLEEKVIQAKNGDESAFDAILCHMYSYLTHLTKEFFIQGSEPQDVFQEGALKLINVIEKYDPTKGGFMAFAQSSIRKHIITTINREMAKKRIILNTSYSLDDSFDNEDGDSISYMDIISNDTSLGNSSIGNPLQIVTKDYEEFLIDEISKNLSDMEQKVFVLRFIEGYSYKEVAEKLHLYKTRKGKRVLDAKSIDNAIVRSRPKIKKSLEKLNIKGFDKDLEIVKTKIVVNKKEKKQKSNKTKRK